MRFFLLFIFTIAFQIVLIAQDKSLPGAFTARESSILHNYTYVIDRNGNVDYYNYKEVEMFFPEFELTTGNNIDWYSYNIDGKYMYENYGHEKFKHEFWGVTFKPIVSSEKKYLTIYTFKNKNYMGSSLDTYKLIVYYRDNKTAFLFEKNSDWVFSGVDLKDEFLHAIKKIGYDHSGTYSKIFDRLNKFINR
jgi:hypothetical protein